MLYLFYNLICYAQSIPLTAKWYKTSKGERNKQKIGLYYICSILFKYIYINNKHNNLFKPKEDKNL